MTSQGTARAPVKTRKSLAETSEAALTHEEIAARAYLLWEQRGGGEGSSADDWYRAEQELQAERGAKTGG